MSIFSTYMCMKFLWQISEEFFVDLIEFLDMCICSQGSLGDCIQCSIQSCFHCDMRFHWGVKDSPKCNKICLTSKTWDIHALFFKYCMGNVISWSLAKVFDRENIFHIVYSKLYSNFTDSNGNMKSANYQFYILKQWQNKNHRFLIIHLFVYDCFHYL